MKAEVAAEAERGEGGEEQEAGSLEVVATLAVLMKKRKINPVRYKTNVNIELDTILQILIAETRVAGNPEGNHNMDGLVC